MTPNPTLLDDNHPLVKAEKKVRKRYKLYCLVHDLLFSGAILVSIMLFIVMILTNFIASVASFLVFVTMFYLFLSNTIGKHLESWHKKELRRLVEEYSTQNNHL
jgi:hypothetical protein